MSMMVGKDLKGHTVELATLAAYYYSILRMWDMSDLFTQGNVTPERCEFLCCHGYVSIVTCYPCDLTGSSGRNRFKT